MLFSRHPGILSRITGALQNSGLMEMWPSEHSEASTAADPTVARPHPRAPAPETESEYHVDSNIVPPPTVHTPLFGPVPLLNQRPCTEADQRAIHLFKLLQERLALREPKTKGRRRKPVINNKKRKFREIRAEDVGPPLKKRRLCGPMKRKAEPTPAEEPPLKKRRLCGPMKRKAEPAPAEEPPLKRRRLLSPEEINADEPADRNRRRYFELVSPLPTIPEEEEEIEGTDEEVRSEDAVVAPATTAPATEESNRRRYFELVSPLPTIPEEEEEIEGTDEEVRSEDAVVAPATTAPATEKSTIESVNVREEEVQEQPEDASVPATEEPATESTNEDEVPTEESAASAASTASTNVSEEEGQPQGTTDETLTDPEVAQDVSAFTTFRYGSGFFSCATKHGRRAVRRSLRVRSHQRSPPTERAPSRLDITGTVQVLDSKQRKVRRCARHLKY